MSPWKAFRNLLFSYLDKTTFLGQYSLSEPHLFHLNDLITLSKICSGEGKGETGLSNDFQIILQNKWQVCSPNLGNY